jgi:hypothetical protein
MISGWVETGGLSPLQDSAENIDSTESSSGEWLNGGTMARVTLTEDINNAHLIVTLSIVGCFTFKEVIID